jgi:hypothetical protein
MVTIRTTDFNRQKVYILPAELICVFFLDLRIKSDYLTSPCWFLSAFAKLRKATISFRMSVRPSARPYVHTERLGSYWTDFREIWCFFFEKTVEKIQISLKSCRSNGYFTWRPMYIKTNKIKRKIFVTKYIIVTIKNNQRRNNKNKSYKQ